ncbi:MAG TPA: hypothetical protein VIJ51_01670 [Solirubrobacteraceae bacterium]
MRSALVVGPYNARSSAERKKLVDAWVPVFAWELETFGPPAVVVTVGNRAREFLAHLERRHRVDLPAAREHIGHCTSVASRPAGKVPGGDPAREEARGQRFSEIRARANAGT